MDNLSEGLKEAVNGNYKLSQLEKGLNFSGTLKNAIQLADEYTLKGKYAEAISLYEKCNAGIYLNDVELLLKLIRCYYQNKDYEKVVATGDILEGNKEFLDTKEMIAYAWSAFHIGETEKAEALFRIMDKRYINYEHRLEYAYFLHLVQRNDECTSLLEKLTEELESMDTYEKRLKKAVFKDIKRLRKMVA